MAFKISKKGVLKEYTQELGETTLVIPDGVESIDAFVFRNCKDIQNVFIPLSVTKIGDSAFEGCESIKTLSIPDTLADFGWRAFHGCKSLKDNKGFVIINSVLFGYFGEDEIVDIPHGVTRIGEFAFDGCDYVTQITIPDSVTTISPRAFDSIQGDPLNIREIFIPESVREIGEMAFTGHNLKIIIDGKDTKLKSLDGMPDVYSNRIYVLNKMSLTKLWDENQKQSVLSFAEDYVNSVAIPESRRKNYISFLSRSKKVYYAIAAKEPKLLQCMTKERIIKKDEIDSLLALVQKEENPESILLILEYKNNLGIKTEKRKAQL